MTSKIIKIILLFLSFSVILGLSLWMVNLNKVKEVPLWSVRSIDTMKSSRDLAGSRLNDPSFDQVINSQIKSIAQTGATHVAISTPYDNEFLPFLRRWVKVARENNLKIWFRGNFSGWEGWFEYKEITRSQHLTMLDGFITKNPDLFEEGDIFTSCPECENGGPGDPRETGDIKGHRKFLVDEMFQSSQSFGKIGKKLNLGYFSMNYDVAKAIMDQETTQALGGVVVIDHYVKDPAKLALDIKEIENLSGGRVLLGEFGAPIPDIHGDLDDAQQAAWIKQALQGLSRDSSIIGLNYWTSYGGTTSLWDDDYTPKPAAFVLQEYFSKKIIAPETK